MENETKHQEEGRQKKSLEERTQKFTEEMKKEIEKGDIHLEEFNPAELLETFLLIYEGIEEKKMDSEEFIRLRRQIDDFMGWAANKIQNIQAIKGKNM